MGARSRTGRQVVPAQSARTHRGQQGRVALEQGRRTGVGRLGEREYCCRTFVGRATLEQPLEVGERGAGRIRPDTTPQLRADRARGRPALVRVVAQHDLPVPDCGARRARRSAAARCRRTAPSGPSGSRRPRAVARPDRGCGVRPPRRRRACWSARPRHSVPRDARAPDTGAGRDRRRPVRRLRQSRRVARGALQRPRRRSATSPASATVARPGRRSSREDPSRHWPRARPRVAAASSCSDEWPSRLGTWPIRRYSARSPSAPRTRSPDSSSHATASAGSRAASHVRSSDAGVTPASARAPARGQTGARAAVP